MNIQLEVPNSMPWTKEEFVAAIKSFASFFVNSRPAAQSIELRKETEATSVEGIEISPELMSFVGIAATNDSRDWKQRKEEFLLENNL